MIVARHMQPAHSAKLRQEIGIQALLEWAFAVEHAQVDFEDPGTLALGYHPIGNAARMADRGALGCRIDGGGRSLPADDADLVAAAVARLPLNLGGRTMAITVAEYARTQQTPDAMISVVPRCVPVSTRQNQTGTWAQTEHVCYVTDRSGRKARRFDSRVCPVTYTPDAATIGRARRKYLAWWAAVFELRSMLISHGNLSRWTLTKAMPPHSPWKKGVAE